MSVDVNKYRVRRPTPDPASQMKRDGAANELLKEDDEAEAESPRSPSPQAAGLGGAAAEQEGEVETVGSATTNPETEEDESVNDGYSSAEFVEASYAERDLLTVNLEEARKAKLEEQWYDGGVIDKIEAARKQGDNGPWVRLKFVAKLVHNGQTHYPHFLCSNTLKPGSRLYNLLEGLVHVVPQNFRLDTLEGMKVRVQIVHETDKSGNVWDNIGSLLQG